MNIETLKRMIEWKKYNKLSFINLYPYQQKFINAGHTKLLRMFLGGNRLGKSVVGGYETACHLTGIYPDWWEGYRIENGGHDFIVAGITQRSVMNIIQKKLLGTADVRVEDKMGTGFIPRDRLNLDLFQKDGARCISIQVKHSDGQWNSLHFFTQADEDKIMGMNIKFGWIDEEDRLNAMDFYSQLVARTMTTKGSIIITATPESGVTPLVKKFSDTEDEDARFMYSQTVSVYDAPHIDDEMIEKIKEAVPEWQWPMRLNGIPSAGQGAVFRINPEDVTYTSDEFDYSNPSLVVNMGLDFGIVVDASVIMVCMYNKADECFYIDEEFYLDKSVEDRSPENMAQVILTSRYPNAEIIVPHDGGMKSAHPQSKAKLMREYGVYNQHEHKNPSDLISKGNNNSVIARIPALDKMAQLFREDRIFINKRCKHLISQIRGYYYDQSADGKVEPKGEDHAIDATRLGIMGLLRGIYSPLDVAEIIGADRWSESVPAITNGMPEYNNSEVFDNDYEWR